MSKLWMPGDPERTSKPRWVEATQSFAMNLQCVEFDGRLKYKKIDLFQSVKISCREDELDEQNEAAYEWCKKRVLRRYNQLAVAIAERRYEDQPYPIIDWPEKTDVIPSRTEVSRASGPRNHAPAAKKF